MKVVIQKIYEYDDTDFSMDAVEVLLYVDGDMVMRGDWYHDRIDSKIVGFLEALEFLGHEYTLERENINEPE